MPPPVLLVIHRLLPSLFLCNSLSSSSPYIKSVWRGSIWGLPAPQAGLPKPRLGRPLDPLLVIIQPDLILFVVHSTSLSEGNRPSQFLAYIKA